MSLNYFLTLSEIANMVVYLKGWKTPGINGAKQLHNKDNTY